MLKSFCLSFFLSLASSHICLICLPLIPLHTLHTHRCIKPSIWCISWHVWCGVVWDVVEWADYYYFLPVIHSFLLLLAVLTQPLPIRDQPTQTRSSNPDRPTRPTTSNNPTKGINARLHKSGPGHPISDVDPAPRNSDTDLQRYSKEKGGWRYGNSGC